MKIKKYINSSDLTNLKEAVEYLYEGDYFVQNFDEEGNKSNACLYKDSLEIAAAYARCHSQDEDFTNQLQELIKIFEKNEIDFVRID